jgi:soluble lytic murein transglycosylase
LEGLVILRITPQKIEVYEKSKFPKSSHRREWKVLLSAFTPFICTIFIVIFFMPLGIPSEPLEIPDSIRHWNESNYSVSPGVPRGIKQGIDALSEERYSAALEVLPTSQEAKNLLLGDYIMLYRAKANLLMKRHQEALEDFRFLERQFPQSRFLRDAVIGQCQTLLELNDPKAALALLDKQKQYSGSDATFYQARALELDGKENQAIALYLQIYSKYAGSFFSLPAEHYLLSLAPKALKGANNYSIRLQKAENLLKAKNYADTRTLLLALGRVSAPDKKTSQKCKLLLAETDYNLNKTTAALASLKSITTADPILHAKALSLEGSCRRRLKQEAAFIALRDKALKLYPKSSDTEELCYSVATYYDVEYESENARKAYKVLYNAFPKGHHAERAQWKLALAAYFSGQLDDAVRGFWNYLLENTNPSYAGSAMYWMGRCYAKLGNLGEARYLFNRAQALGNESYYGRRAREANAALVESANTPGNPIAGIDFKKVTSVCDSIHHSSLSLKEPDIDGIRTLERVKQLIAADLQDLALSELRWAIQQYPQNSRVFYYILSQIYAGKENFNSAFTYLQNAFPDYSGRPLDALPEDIWQLLYPMRHMDIISEQASVTGLEPALILGVIRQESGFKINAQSKAKAQGLMQLLPSTAMRLVRSVNLPRSKAKNLFDAENNITIGTLHLSYLMKQYGKAEFALAAYNAGESRVDRWMHEFGNSDMAEFVEQIPFSETRNYVKQILSNRYHYEALIPRGTPSNSWETQ